MNRREQRKRSSVQLSSPLSPLAPVQAFPKIMIPHRVRIDSEAAGCGAKQINGFASRGPEEFLNRREQRKRSSVQLSSPLFPLASVQAFPNKRLPVGATTMSETRKVVS